MTSCLAREPFGPGYVWVDPAGRRSLHSGHLAAAGLFVASLAVYVALGVANRPGAEAPLLDRLPALGALLLVLTMAAWIVPALSFLLDRFRAPVVAAIVLVSFALYALAGADHFFALRTPAAGLPASPAEDLALVDSWFAPGADGRPPRPIVAVAAAGGGITASAWTAAVLSGLAAGDEGADFLASLKLISGVSGGAVGAMYFLDRLPPVALREMPGLNGATVAAIRDAASASSLDAVGWGLAYPDLLRTVLSFPFATVWPELDRGAALEASWRRRLASPPERATLAAWRADALAGRKLLVVFGATSVETGARLELSTAAVADAVRARDFWSLYPGWDLDVATAARLSATFPFVSLAARARAPRTEGDRRPPVAGTHLVDGGYADNTGVVAALALLDRGLARRCGAAGACDAPPIVLLRVRAFDERSGDPGSAVRGDAWLTSAVGPLLTLIAVRTASQADRNDIDLSLWTSKWRPRGVDLIVVDCDLGGAGPLSWKLTAGEREAILAAWKRSGGLGELTDQVAEPRESTPR